MDGWTWTAHTTAPTTPPAPFYRVDPHQDLADERTAGRRASIGLIAGAVIGIANASIAAVALHSYFPDLAASVDRSSRTGRVVAPVPAPGAFILVELLSLGGLVVEILLMIWLFRAAGFARKAGLPARRDPVWGIVGFLVRS